jgi:hypothetical protein
MAQKKETKEIIAYVLSHVLFIGLMLATIPSTIISTVLPLISTSGLPVILGFVLGGLCVLYTWSSMSVLNWGPLQNFVYNILRCKPPSDDTLDLEKIKQQLESAKNERKELLAKATKLNISVIDNVQSSVAVNSAENRLGQKVLDFIIKLFSWVFFIMIMVAPLIAIIYQATTGVEKFFVFLGDNAGLRLPLSFLPLLHLILGAWSQLPKLLPGQHKNIWRMINMYITYFAHHWLGLSTSNWKQYEDQKREGAALKKSNKWLAVQLAEQELEQYCDIRIKLLTKIQPQGRIILPYDRLSQNEQAILKMLLPDNTTEGPTQFRWDNLNDAAALRLLSV